MISKTIFNLFSSVIAGFFNFLQSIIHVILAGAATGTAFYLGRILDRLITEDIETVKNMRKLLLDFHRYFQEESFDWRSKKIQEYVDRMWSLKDGLLFRYDLLDQSLEKSNLLIDKFSRTEDFSSPQSQLRTGLSCLWELDTCGYSKRLHAISAYFDKNFFFRLFIRIRRYAFKFSRCSSIIYKSLYCTCLKRVHKCVCVKVSEQSVIKVDSLLKPL